MYVGVKFVVFCKGRKQNLVQSRFAGAHTHHPAHHFVEKFKFFFARLYMLVSDGDMAVKLFALGSKFNPFVRTGEQHAF